MQVIITVVSVICIDLDQMYCVNSINFMCSKMLRFVPKNIFNQALKYLHLNLNSIGEIPPAIKNAQNLCGLGLGHNMLRFLPKDILKLQYLRSIYLDGNFFPDPTGYNVEMTFHFLKKEGYIL